MLREICGEVHRHHETDSLCQHLRGSAHSKTAGRKRLRRRISRMGRLRSKFRARLKNDHLPNVLRDVDELTSFEWAYGFGNLMLWTVAEPNADLRCAAKSSLAAALDQRAESESSVT